MGLRSIGIAASLLLAPLPALADPELAESVEAIFADLVLEDAPGAGVIVADDGETLHEFYYGEADLGHDVPIGPDTVFHVASISKQFTAYAVMRLAREGRIDLDAPFRTYLPDAPDYGSPITVRQLIHHTSGLPSHYVVADAAGMPSDVHFTPARAKRWPEAMRRLNHTPGAEISYTNLGYAYLSDIVESVSGESLKDWLQDNVFTPLGMRTTHLHTHSDHVVPHRASSYRKAGGTWVHSHYINSLSGGTNVNTTPRDLAIWAAHLMELKTSDPALWTAMTTPGRLNDGSVAARHGTLPYAAGLYYSDVGGVPVLQHGGANAKYRANMMLEPETGLFAAVLSNTAAGGASGRVDEVMRAALASRGVAVEAEKKAPDAAVDATFDPAALARLAGNYTVARAKLPPDFGVKGRENIPELAMLQFRTTNSDLQWRFDGGYWETLEPLSATSARFGDHVLRFYGPAPVIVADSGEVVLTRGGCSTRLMAGLAGHYTHAVLPPRVAVSRNGDELVLRYGEGDSRRLACGSDGHLVPAIAHNADWPGMMLLEPVMADGEVVALDVSFGERLRRLRFAKTGVAP